MASEARFTHSAFRAVSVVEPLPLKVAAIDAEGGRVFVASQEGALCEFELDPRAGERKVGSEARFRQVLQAKNFGKVVAQLEVVPSHRLLLALVDSYVRAHSLDNLQPFPKMEHTKGAVTFCVNTANRKRRDTSSPLLLCVSMRRKLLIHKWEGPQQGFRQTREIRVESSPATLQWAGKNLFAAFSRDYALIDVTTGGVTELFPLGKRGKPLPAVLLHGQEVLLVKDNQGICVSWDGKPTRNEPVMFGDVPVAVCYAHPYVIAVLPSCVEVRSMVTRSLTQNIDIRGARLVCLGGASPQTHQDPAAANDSIIDDDDLAPSPSPAGHFNQSLFVASTSTLQCFEVVPLELQVEELLQRELFAEALALASLPRDDEWDRGRDRRLAEIHALYGYHLFNRGDFERAMMYFQQADCDPRQMLALFPDVLPPGQCRRVRHPVSVTRIEGEDNLLRALSALIPYLSQLRSRLMLSSSSSAYSRLGRLHRLGSSLEGDLSADGSLPVDSYLDSVGDLEQLEEGELPLGSLVDTVLLHCYLFTDDGLVMPFLQARNQCDIQECEKVLRAYGKFPEMVQLHKSAGNHRQALDLLRTLGQSDNQLNPLFGTEETVRYLQELASQPQNEFTPLVLEYSKWVLAADPDQGLRIFTHSLDKGPNISPHVVLDHLKKSSDAEVCMAYLEAVISQGHETNVVFHNELITYYLEAIRKLLADQQQERSKQHAPAGSEPGRLGILRKKLLMFMQHSSSYSAEEILSKFPRNELLEERAVLLSRLHRHLQALTIYVHKLHDTTAAEQYCERMYSPASEQKRDVYMCLLRVYLQPSEGQQPLLQPALSLLRRFHDRVDAIEAVEMLPISTPIKDVQRFLCAVLAQKRQVRRNNQVIKHLHRAEHLQVREECLKARHPRILVDRDTVCPRCHKKLGRSAFARYPNGVVVHYICSDDKYVCPVTGRRFGPAGSLKPSASIGSLTSSDVASHPSVAPPFRH